MELAIDCIDSRRVSEAFAASKTLSRTVSEQEPATFEDAIQATKFGKFNIMMASLAMLACVCPVFDTSTMSFTFVAAQCDLDLSLADKGLLNAVTYAGMISSAVIWGFLFDVLGRRKLLIYGYLIDAVFVFMSAFSQSLPLLLVSKYLQGLIINGPMAALSSYIAEFQCAQYRPIFQMIIGACNSIATVMLPLLAWAVLPYNLDFKVLTLNFHSWNVFLFITGLPAFATGLIVLMFPESPKFLMTCGENEKALEVFRKVYSMNTGMPPDTYPIKRLIDETKIQKDSNGRGVTHKSNLQAMKEGFRQLRPIFFKPHLPRLTLACTIFFFAIMSVNMLRLWLPQIFQVMTDYQLSHNGESASLCVMLDTFTPARNTTIEECVVNTDVSAIYRNSMIVGSVSFCTNIIAGTLIRLIGKKKMLVFGAFFGGIMAISLYFSKSPSVAIALSSLFIAGGVLSNNVMISVTVDMFPTTLRTMAISLGMMIGRIGAMSGNFVFPYLLESGCEPPFFVVGGFMIAAGIASFGVPNTDMKALT